jgi:hypothetical protein
MALCESVWQYWPVIADRNALRTQAWVAAAVGLLISALMFAFSWSHLDPFGFFTWSPFLYWPQFVGVAAGIALGGDSVTRPRIAAISIPVNAVIYAAIIFGVTRVIVRARRSA